MPAQLYMWGTGDFNADGVIDIVWHNYQSLVIWHMAADGFTVQSTTEFEFPLSFSWWVRSVGDFNGDGHADIAWGGYTPEYPGLYAMWLMNGTTVAASELTIPRQVPLSWWLEPHWGW
jgi:hypothetical protein